ncbi:MAG: hypothetical protein IJP31_11505 [Lachnospiraceae bacterium]|nr:hypothetical protein [Lachnospiraceae bacterium]
MDSRIALSPGKELQLYNKEGSPIRYTIVREIGRGSSCIVYEASHKTTTGDEKLYRIKECYPHRLQICREESGRLLPAAEDKKEFEKFQRKMRSYFKMANSLFYSEGITGMLTDQLDVHTCNDTTYIISAFSAEKTLATYQPVSIKECVILVKQVAYVLEKIHQQGFLYLDTKPGNVLVVEGLPKRIQLFDFDSLLSVGEIKNRRGLSYSDLRLSYSKGFAPIELQTGRIAHIGAHTDVFGVGALLFYLLFGDTPTAMDSEADAFYPFDRMNYDSKRCDDKLFAALTRFFHKALANYYLDRYPGMQETVEKLEEIENLADTMIPRIFSTILPGTQYILGREKEFRQIDEFLRDPESRCMFVTGMGGIGKSTLVRGYIQSRRHELDTVLYLQFLGTMETTIVNDGNIEINTLDYSQSERSGRRYFDQKIQKIRELVRGTKTLIVIDNFSGEIDRDTLEVLKTDWKVIIVSRQVPCCRNAKELQVTAISDRKLLQDLFEYYLETSICPMEQEDFNHIADKVKGHTLVLELIAKQIGSSHMTLAKARELVDEQGFPQMAPEKVDYEKDGQTDRETIGNIIDVLFQKNHLSKEKRILLKTLSLTGIGGIEINLYQRIFQLESKDDINDVIKDGWLMLKGDMISMHPVIQEAVHQWEWTLIYQKAAKQFLSYFHVKIRMEGRKNNCPKKLYGGIKDPSPADRRKLEAYLWQAEQILEQGKREKEIKQLEEYQNLLFITILYMPCYREDYILSETGRIFSEYKDNFVWEKTPGLWEQKEGENLLTLLKIYRKAALVYADKGEIKAMKRTISLAGDMAKRVRHHQAYALYYDLASEYYDVLLNGAYDAITAEEEKLLQKLLVNIDKTIRYAKKLITKDTEHLYAKNLLAKATILMRSNRGKKKEIKKLITLAKRVIEDNTLPYADVRHQYYMVCGWYFALIGEDIQTVEEMIHQANVLSDEIFATDMDKIDCTIVPCANIYLELQCHERAMEQLCEGIKLCLRHKELEIYDRKRKELYGYLREVADRADEPERYRRLIGHINQEELQEKETFFMILDDLCSGFFDKE